MSDRLFENVKNMTEPNDIETDAKADTGARGEERKVAVEPKPTFDMRKYIVAHWRGLVLIFAPIFWLVAFIPGFHKACRCGYVLLVMCTYFATGVLPVIVVAIFPILAYPAMGIMSTERACNLYFKDTVLMFSSYIASAAEYCGLHTRLGYAMILFIGCNPHRILLGLCAITFLMSMWTSNNAAVSLMVGVVDAILLNLAEQGVCKLYLEEDSDLPENERRASRLKTCFFLTVAFAASLGGSGTYLGSPSNNVARTVYASYFPDAAPISFVSHMAYATPIVAVCTVLMVFNLQIMLMGLFRPKSFEAKLVNTKKEVLKAGQRHIKKKYREMGPITTHEISIAVLIVIMIILYVTRERNDNFGWAYYLAEDKIHYTTPIAVVLILMFILPTNYKFLNYKKAESLEPTQALHALWFAQTRVPWSMIFLIGGGTVVAEGSSTTGMACAIGRWLNFLRVVPEDIVLLIILLAEVILTNFLPNVHCTHITIPIVTELAEDLEVHPLWLVMPATLCANMPFLLTSGSPSNVLAWHYARFSRPKMFTVGLVTTGICVAVVYFLTQTWGLVVYPEMSTFPDWVEILPNRSCF